MKVETRTREIVSKQEYKVYIAKDGTEFNNDEECQKYDDSAVCAYKTLLSKVLKPIVGSFSYKDAKEHPELVNESKNLIDDILDDGRRECEYFSFKPETQEDVRNFIAMLKVRNPSISSINAFTRLEELKEGNSYVVQYYADAEFYKIINAEKFSDFMKSLINKVLE